MRWTRGAVAAATLSIVIAGCGVGPSDRPGVAVDRPHDAGTSAGTESAEVPLAEAPENALSWSECTSATFDDLGLTPDVGDVVVECATFHTDIDVEGRIQGIFTADATRARLPGTPTDVAPLVLTSGTDRTSRETLAALAAGPESQVLADQPVVAVDRRGLGAAQPVDCLPDDMRAGFADPGDEPDRVGALAELSTDATIACRDFLQPYENTFDLAHAADDLDALREEWGVEQINLLGTGNGARVALSYARRYGEHLARLVLDSPESVTADSSTRTLNRVIGAEAAFTGFVQHCLATQCALGSDPAATVTRLVQRAESGNLTGISGTELLTTVSAYLGDPRTGAEPAGLADPLAAAGNGDTAPLRALYDRLAPRVRSDGQFVNRCSDNSAPISPERIRELAGEWQEKYPIFGKHAAESLMVCSAWPATDSAPLPEELDLPVLVLHGAADPVTGDGVASVTGALGAAGATHATMTWQGRGHPAVTGSGCAQQAVTAYLRDASLPDDGDVCPA